MLGYAKQCISEAQISESLRGSIGNLLALTKSAKFIQISFKVHLLGDFRQMQVESASINHLLNQHHSQGIPEHLVSAQNELLLSVKAGASPIVSYRAALENVLELNEEVRPFESVGKLNTNKLHDLHCWGSLGMQLGEELIHLPMHSGTQNHGTEYHISMLKAKFYWPESDCCNWAQSEEHMKNSELEYMTLDQTGDCQLHSFPFPSNPSALQSFPKNGTSTMKTSSLPGSTLPQNSSWTLGTEVVDDNALTSPSLHLFPKAWLEESSDGCEMIQCTQADYYNNCKLCCMAPMENHTNASTAENFSNGRRCFQREQQAAQGFSDKRNLGKLQTSCGINASSKAGIIPNPVFRRPNIGDTHSWYKEDAEIRSEVKLKTWDSYIDRYLTESNLASPSGFSSQAKCSLTDLPHYGISTSEEHNTFYDTRKAAHDPQMSMDYLNALKNNAYTNDIWQDLYWRSPFKDQNVSRRLGRKIQKCNHCGQTTNCSKNESAKKRRPKPLHPTSRLFIGNIGWWVDETMLLQSFCEFGVILDIQVMWNTKMLARGKRINREFAFISYANCAEATKALKYMHGCKISCLQKDNHGLTVEYEAGEGK